MTIDTLQDLYLYGIRDMNTGCKATFDGMRAMRAAATHAEVQTFMDGALASMEHALDVFDGILTRHGAEQGETANKALKALADEGREWVVETTYADDALRDLAILEKARNVAHYPIAGFTAFVAQARALGHDADVEALESHAKPDAGSEDQMARLDAIEADLLSGLHRRAA